jgi:murein L,D-transpeptidase YafK
MSHWFYDIIGPTPTVSAGRMASRRRILIVLALGFFPWLLVAADLANLRIEVFKSKRELQFFDGQRLIKTYRVALGTNPKPPKKREGDKATPEGSYFICRKNPRSQFYLSMGISYPGPHDAERGLKAGLISEAEHKAILEAHRKRTTPPWNTRLGGEVFIHGRGSKSDWTLGCIALDDSDIDELYRLVPVGTPIAIHP